MASWLVPGSISHPWFKLSTPKRKRFAKDDSPTSSRSRSPSPPAKRGKHTVLEADFSSLSLSGREPGGQTFVSEPNVLDYPSMEDDSLPPIVDLQSTIEEPDISEVKMKSSSWYELEPDRIVVTSLESSDEEELDADPASISVSPALLRKISNQTGRDLGTQLITLPANTSQALILYKPLPVPGVACEEQGRDENDKIGNIVADDDAMDVEL